MTTTTEPVRVPGAVPEDAESTARRAFARDSVVVLVFTVGVVLFGAVVRITFSGDGCGQHWPTCQGEVLHVPRNVKTAIELSHRLTSGLSGLLVLALAVRAFRRFPAGHLARTTGTASLFFMAVEALVGRELVKLRLVGHDASAARAVWMALHLVNTSLLLGAIALTAWAAGSASPVRLRPTRPLHALLLGALGGTLGVSITGAITALGDTVFPVRVADPLAARLAADYGAASTFLERARAVHPFVALATAAFVLAVASRAKDASPSPGVGRAARAAIVLVFSQVIAGVVNIALSAPGWMQVVHLGLATSLWLALVTLYARAVAAPRAPSK